MTKTQHTPTPWTLNTQDEEYCLPINKIFGADNLDVAETNGATLDEMEANAQHIVKCVNLHDKLVEALGIIKTIIIVTVMVLLFVTAVISLTAEDDCDKRDVRGHCIEETKALSILQNLHGGVCSTLALR
jgi:hypothetical protein